MLCAVRSHPLPALRRGVGGRPGCSRLAASRGELCGRCPAGRPRCLPQRAEPAGQLREGTEGRREGWGRCSAPLGEESVERWNCWLRLSGFAGLSEGSAELGARSPAGGSAVPGPGCAVTARALPLLGGARSPELSGGPSLSLLPRRNGRALAVLYRSVPHPGGLWLQVKNTEISKSPQTWLLERLQTCCSL